MGKESISGGQSVIMCCMQKCLGRMAEESELHLATF